MKQTLPAITEPVDLDLIDNLIGRFVKITTVTDRVESGYLRRIEYVPGHADALWFLVLERRPGQYVQRTFQRASQAMVAYRCERCIRQEYLGAGGPGHWPLTTCRMGRTAEHCTCAGCW